MQEEKEYKVLIVEDENIVAMDLSRRLSRLGYQVIGMASNGKRALELVESRHPDIILMDIHIKGNKDGIEVADDINELYHIPVIFLTAYSEDSTLARARQTRPYGYLLKPFSERELHVAIQVALERHAADLQLVKRETHLKLALNAAKLGTWEMESDKTVIMGYSPCGKLAVVENWQNLHDYIVDSDQIRVQQALTELQSSPDIELDLEFEADLPEQGHRWYKLYGKSFNGGRDQHRVGGILQDITEHHQTEIRLRQAATAFRCSADGIVVLNKDKKVESINMAFSKITGLAPKQCIGKELEFLSEKYLNQDVFETLWPTLRRTGSWQGEISFHQRDNTLIHALVNIGSVPDLINGEAQYVVVVSDVTPIRDAQKKLSHIAYYDTLTGLPNRNLFMDRLEVCLSKSKREGNSFGILYLDLDHFKRVNDTLGHQMGDNLLKGIAKRLKAKLRTSDTLCRIGGDEFIVIAEAIASPRDLEILAEKILELLSHPIQLGSVNIIPGASIGICLYPQHTDDRDEMIKMADTAMYAAKSEGRKGYAIYEPRMSEHIAHYFTREQELRHALSNNELRLFYQPQYDCRSGALTGLEALIRWQHPNQGLLGAAEVIPFAESNALIIEIGNWVLNESCRQLRAWLEQKCAPRHIAVNVSARQLEDRNFVHIVNRVAQSHQVPLNMLELEVTESCLQNSEIGLYNLRRLKELGANISIDDFGTGYSCMSSLKSLPITALKIDRCFVQNVHTEPSDRAIASAIIALAKQLGLRTTAEGIETQAQALLLRQDGCDDFQGYLYSEPLPAELVTRYLKGSLSDENTSSQQIA